MANYLQAQFADQQALAAITIRHASKHANICTPTAETNEHINLANEHVEMHFQQTQLGTPKHERMSRLRRISRTHKGAHKSIST